MLGNTRGFTISELLIAITVGSILATTVLSISLFFFSDVMRSETEARLTLQSQVLLTSTVNDLRVASAVRSSNIIADPHNSSGWNTSNPNHILIIATPALDMNNNIIMDESQGAPYANERVYFVEEGTLYRRTLAHPSAGGNVSKTSCPMAIADESCPADGELTEDFASMQFTFYDQNGAVTGIISEARSVELIVVMTKKVFGKEVNITNTARAVMRNP